MRIVTGSARGRRLRAPHGRAVRPTADRVKESIFSMLESRYGCEGIAVLDLFAGSGSLGIEALSRGAADAVFVEQHARGRRFGGVFLDPPYDRGYVAPTLAALADTALVTDGGWVVVEHGRDEQPAAAIGTLVRRDTRRFGDTHVSTFTAGAAEE